MQASAARKLAQAAVSQRERDAKSQVAAPSARNAQRARAKATGLHAICFCPGGCARGDELRQRPTHASTCEQCCEVTSAILIFGLSTVPSRCWTSMACAEHARSRCSSKPRPTAVAERVLELSMNTVFHLLCKHDLHPSIKGMWDSGSCATYS